MLKVPQNAGMAFCNTEQRRMRTRTNELANTLKDLMRKSNVCLVFFLLVEEVICVLGADETRNNKQTYKKRKSSLEVSLSKTVSDSPPSARPLKAHYSVQGSL